MKMLTGVRGVTLAIMIFVCVSACSSAPEKPSDQSVLELHVRVVACNISGSCVDLSVSSASVVATQGNRELGKAKTDDSGIARLNLGSMRGIVHVVITSPVIKLGRQALDVNIDASLVTATVNYPLASNLLPGPG